MASEEDTRLDNGGAESPVDDDDLADELEADLEKELAFDSDDNEAEDAGEGSREGEPQGTEGPVVDYWP
jgi:hypothetical protein